MFEVWLWGQIAYSLPATTSAVQWIWIVFSVGDCKSYAVHVDYLLLKQVEPEEWCVEGPKKHAGIKYNFFFFFWSNTTFDQLQECFYVGPSIVAEWKIFSYLLNQQCWNLVTRTYLCLYCSAKWHHEPYRRCCCWSVDHEEGNGRVCILFLNVRFETNSYLIVFFFPEQYWVYNLFQCIFLYIINLKV